jgi:hypothetical protein
VHEVVTELWVARPRDDVFAFLADPRHHFIANHEGPIVDQSPGPLHAGSFFVLAFDQIRARVTFESVEPPERLVVATAMTGRLSGGTTSRREYVLTEDGDATRVEVRASGSGGWISWRPLVRAAERASSKQLKRRIESA